ncbi:hypothetical protein FB451DRAFT_1181574 [Mycena latifolia]|nr:hypothetical protein FB451DRAFT_1181574 [Mycena latifolia]
MHRALSAHIRLTTCQEAERILVTEARDVNRVMDLARWIEFRPPQGLSWLRLKWEIVHWWIEAADGIQPKFNFERALGHSKKQMSFLEPSNSCSAKSPTNLNCITYRWDEQGRKNLLPRRKGERFAAPPTWPGTKHLWGSEMEYLSKVRYLVSTKLLVGHLERPTQPQQMKNEANGTECIRDRTDPFKELSTNRTLASPSPDYIPGAEHIRRSKMEDISGVTYRAIVARAGIDFKFLVNRGFNN